MHRILIVLLMLTAGMAHARILHVGDNTIKLSQTKTTTPALHIRVGDEIWYGNMTRCPMPMNENTDKKLRVKYNGADYYVSETDKDYVIVDGKLVAVNCNVYLESTGTQIIDSLYINNQSFLRVAGTFMLTEYKANDSCCNFSLLFGSYAETHVSLTVFSPDSNSDYYIEVGSDWGISNSRGPIKMNLYHSYSFDLTADSNTLTGYVADFDVDTKYNGTLNNSHALCFFGSYHHEQHGYYAFSSMRYYNFKIYSDNDTLVRHFVPVPCGLKIGDFIVPENGMWDIVEQKFYGNMGTGEFIYGVDE